jgi:hypothetical protein
MKRLEISFDMGTFDDAKQKKKKKSFIYTPDKTSVDTTIRKVRQGKAAHVKNTLTLIFCSVLETTV